MEFDVNKLAFCGIYCPQCSFLTAFETGRREHLSALPEQYDKCKDADLADIGDCPGCKNENICGNCNIKECAAGRKISSCAECDSFPCELVLEFGNDGVPHHLQALDNLRVIRAQGYASWFEGFKKNLQCSCGKRQSWYYKCSDHSAK